LGKGSDFIEIEYVHFRALIVHHVVFILTVAEENHGTIMKFKSSFLFVIMGYSLWNFTPYGKNMSTFKLRKSATKEIGLKVRDFKTPVDCIVAEGMALAWACRSSK